MPLCLSHITHSRIWVYELGQPMESWSKNQSGSSQSDVSHRNSHMGSLKTVATLNEHFAFYGDLMWYNIAVAFLSSN